MTKERGPIHTLLSISSNFSGLEQYLFQLLTIPLPSKRDNLEDEYHWTLKGKEMPYVTQAMRMGIMRSADTEQSATVTLTTLDESSEIY